MVAMLACLSASYAATPSAPTLQVISCQGLSDYDGAGIAIDYRNRSTTAYKTIVWRAIFGGHPFDFIATAHAAPGAQTQRAIWHARSNSEPPRYNSVQGVCRPIEAQQDDGEIWTDSNVTDAPAIAASPSADPLPTARADTASPVPATFDNPLHVPIGIVACNFGFDTVRHRGYGAMNVRFRNLSPKTITRVVFRGLFGDGGVDFVFGGTFSPGVLISSNQWVNALVGRAPRLLRSDLGGTSRPTTTTSTTVR